MTLTLETIGSSSPWIAKITGTDPKFGLKREFLSGIRDYSNANSVRTRGVTTNYELLDGLYEINHPCSWKRTERYFAVVSDGELKEVDAATARTLIAESANA